MSNIKESDWKLFCTIKEIAISRYGERCLNEYREILDDESSQPINRHLLLHRISDNLNKQYNLIFQDHARSKMVLQLLAIRGEKLVEKSELNGLSEDILERTNPERVKW